MRPALAISILLLAACELGRPERVTKPVSFALLEDYDKGTDLGDVARDFALMRELEVTTWRGSLGWDDYEPRPGSYDFEWLHRFAELAAREGITLRPYVAYTPEWAAAGGKDGQAWNDPPASLDRWAEFLQRLTGALARHRNVASLEIYNEQNVPQWWEGSVDTYARLFQRSVLETTRLPLFPGGLVYPDAEWFETVCGAALGHPLAAAAFHAYPETWTPPDVTVENYLGPGYHAFVETVDRACGPTPVWINEAGFATLPGKSEDEQAHWWARAVATFLAEPRVEHIGIYEIKDLPPGSPVIGDAPNYHLGLTRADRTPKRAFRAVDVLTDLLDTGTLEIGDDLLAVTRESAGGGPVHHHLFVRPDGQQVAFVWTSGATPVTLQASFTRPGGTIAEHWLDGRTAPRVAFSGTLPELQLAPGVVRIFVVYPPR